MSTMPSVERSERWPRPAFSPLPGEMAGLPRPLTSLVGREPELAKARALLGRPDVRLVTLIGPGGIGKTRLALQLGAELAEDFADGVCFVPLETLRQAEQVAAAIAQAIGLQGGETDAVVDAVAKSLATANMLLVVDNFEHVAAAATILTTLLARCPRLKMLVTSQVVLRVSGEHVMPIPTLLAPEPQTAFTGDDLGRFPAVQLFVERVQAVDPTFILTRANAALVAEICGRLDGLPLAIELVAPRVRHLALADVLRLLDRRLPLLTGGSRDQPNRLQTMRNAIAWSNDLLAPGEQVFLRCLAVFTGGFSLEAAEWVARETPLAPGENDRWANSLPVFEGLGSMIDASLLQIEHIPGPGARYRMLETIREFALERLEASGDSACIRQAHATFHLALAERYQDATLVPDGDQVLAMLEADHANFQAALGWLEETAQHDLLLRLASALGHFWSDSDHYREGRSWLEQVISSDSTLEPARSRALVALGFIEIYQGLYDEGEASLLAGLDSCRAHGNAFDTSLALIGLGGLAGLSGEFERGTAYLEACLGPENPVADARLAGILEGWALLNLAVIARSRGDHVHAEQRLAEALACMRTSDYVIGQIMALGDSGDLLRDRGAYGRALALYREALDLGTGRPSARVMIDVVEGVAIVALGVGQTDLGVRLLGAADVVRERVGLRYRVAENQAALDHARGAALDRLGQQAFDDAWAAGRNLSAAQARAEATTPFPLIAGVDGSGGHRTRLTPREAEIMPLVVAGHTDAAIAARLFLSVRTVENHVAHILAKFGVNTRTAIGAAAGLESPDPLPSF